MTDLSTETRLPWTTPVLEPLGTMADVMNDAAGDLDFDGLNENAAS